MCRRLHEGVEGRERRKEDMIEGWKRVLGRGIMVANHPVSQVISLGTLPYVLSSSALALGPMAKAKIPANPKFTYESKVR